MHNERNAIARGLAPIAGVVQAVERRWPLIVGALVVVMLASTVTQRGRGLRLLRRAVGAWQTWRWITAALRGARATRGVAAKQG